MKHHIDKPHIEIPDIELAEIEAAVEKLHDTRDRATWEAACRSCGVGNEIQIWRSYDEWKRSNDPEPA